MRLMCTSNKDHVCDEMPKIEVGEEVNSIAEKSFLGMEYWQLAEYAGTVIEDVQYRFWYDKRNFATLPDQSAQEMSEESQEAIIYQR